MRSPSLTIRCAGWNPPMWGSITPIPGCCWAGRVRAWAWLARVVRDMPISGEVTVDWLTQDRIQPPPLTLCLAIHRAMACPPRHIAGGAHSPGARMGRSRPEVRPAGWGGCSGGRRAPRPSLRCGGGSGWPTGRGWSSSTPRGPARSGGWCRPGSGRSSHAALRR